MKFPYVEYLNAADSATLYRPIIPVRLQGPRGAIRRLGLVDTGSDYTLLPSWLAAAWGISLDSQQAIPISGVEGIQLDARLGRVELELHRRRSSMRWSALAFFADQDYVLLGNEGFLEYFVAKFDWARRTLELTPNERFPPPLG